MSPVTINQKAAKDYRQRKKHRPSELNINQKFQRQRTVKEPSVLRLKLERTKL
jgi:hypothetical protein